jgi:hypothetical protein
MFLWSWLGNFLHGVKVKIAPVVVGILNVVSGLETTGVLDGVAKVIDTYFKTSLAENVNALVKANVIKQLALWLGVEDLPASPTVAQEQQFSQDITQAFLSKKAQQSVPGQVAQELGVQVFNIIQTTVGADKVADKAVSAGQMATMVEEAFEDLQGDIATAQTAASSVNPATVPATGSVAPTTPAQ